MVRDNIQLVAVAVVVESFGKIGRQFLFRLCQWYELAYNMEQIIFIFFQICPWHDDVIIENSHMHWMMQKVGFLIHFLKKRSNHRLNFCFNVRGGYWNDTTQYGVVRWGRLSRTVRFGCALKVVPCLSISSLISFHLPSRLDVLFFIGDQATHPWAPWPCQRAV